MSLNGVAEELLGKSLLVVTLCFPRKLRQAGSVDILSDLLKWTGVDDASKLATPHERANRWIARTSKATERALSLDTKDYYGSKRMYWESQLQCVQDEDVKKNWAAVVRLFYKNVPMVLKTTKKDASEYTSKEKRVVANYTVKDKKEVTPERCVWLQLQGQHKHQPLSLAEKKKLKDVAELKEEIKSDPTKPYRHHSNNLAKKLDEVQTPDDVKNFQIEVTLKNCQNWARAFKSPQPFDPQLDMAKVLKVVSVIEKENNCIKVLDTKFGIVEPGMPGYCITLALVGNSEIGKKVYSFWANSKDPQANTDGLWSASKALSSTTQVFMFYLQDPVDMKARCVLISIMDTRHSRSYKM